MRTQSTDYLFIVDSGFALVGDLIADTYKRNQIEEALGALFRPVPGDEEVALVRSRFISPRTVGLPERLFDALREEVVSPKGPGSG